MRSTRGFAIFTTVVRLSIPIMLTAMPLMFARPASADVIETFVLNSFYGLGEIRFDLTDNSIAGGTLFEFGPNPSEWEGGFLLNEFYLCCGSQGDSFLGFYNGNTDYGGVPGNADFSFETIPEFNTPTPVGSFIGSIGDYNITDPGVGESNGCCAAGEWEVIAITGVPEPSSLALMLAGLACLWGVRRIAKRPPLRRLQMTPDGSARHHHRR